MFQTKYQVHWGFSSPWLVTLHVTPMPEPEPFPRWTDLTHRSGDPAGGRGPSSSRWSEPRGLISVAGPIMELLFLLFISFSFLVRLICIWFFLVLVFGFWVSCCWISSDPFWGWRKPAESWAEMHLVTEPQRRSYKSPDRLGMEHQLASSFLFGYAEFPSGYRPPSKKLPAMKVRFLA